MKTDKLDAIGYIDDQLVEKSDKYSGSKKKNTWIQWSAIAACLCLCLAGAFAVFPHFADQEVETPVPDDVYEPVYVIPDVETPAPDDAYEAVFAIPMVYVNDQLYVQAYDGTIISEKQDDFIELGTITSSVFNDDPDSDEIPSKNMQTNQALVGCDVYQNGDDIVVYVERIGYMVFVEYGGPDTDMWNEALK